jgi:1-phosphofructokinase
MIYTVTLNPSIDYIVQVPDLVLGETNRASGEQLYPGGKGINVSRLLAHLGQPTRALGFLGGFTGEHIRQTLSDEGLNLGFTPIAGNSRVNVKIKGGRETEINATGPKITNDEVAAFKKEFDGLTASDIVILSGSIPKQLDQTMYDQLIATVTERGATFVLDTTGEQLARGLKHHPLLVKPNREEVGELYQTPVTDQQTLQGLGHRLIADGAQFALISLAGDGAALFTPTGDYFAKPVTGTVKNSVGAGDSMVAGFVGTWLKTHDVVESFKMGVASGTATAFSDDIATAEMINKIAEKVAITAFTETEIGL